MTHIESRSKDELPELATVLNNAEATMGFIPNSMLTMAHMPQLTMAFSILAGTVFGADLKNLLDMYIDEVPTDANAAEALPPETVQLIAYSVSLSAGCRYCQAHTSNNANRFGISEEKLQAVLQFETSPLFSQSERAVIDLALNAGQVPNGVNKSHIEALQANFSERQIVQIVGVVSLFGFLNRWNDTLATSLEDHPVEFAQRVLSAGGWQIDKHV